MRRLGNSLTSWRADKWFENPAALVRDLENVPKRSVDSRRWEGITKALILILMLYRTETGLWGARRVGLVLKFIQRGLTSARAGKEGYEITRANMSRRIERRNAELIRRAIVLR